MPRVRVKMCGITRTQDADVAVAEGVDAIGMILHADSPRAVSAVEAVAIRRTIPPFVTVIGVSVNASLDKARWLYQEVGLDYLQLHGEETSEYADELGLPYIRAIRAKSVEQVQLEMDQHQMASAFLLDPYVEGQHGGTGQSLDLDLWPGQADKPLILAGGLSSENLEQRIREAAPHAIDLNSGLESAPGVKSHDSIKAAMNIVRRHWSD